MIVPRLGEVQETLLIPLYGRAKDAAARRSVLGDERAREMVASIDYDFARFRGGSLPGSVLRTSIFDGWVRDFLAEHPDGTVVEIGCGLNTRFERVDNGTVRWFDMDLPDVVELRRRFLDDDARRTTLAGSAFDLDWMDPVAAPSGPWLFVAEAMFLYFSAEQVHQAIDQLAQRFPGSLLAFDTGGRTMMKSQRHNGAMKRVDATMQWICDDPGELSAWGLQLLDTRTFGSPQPRVAATWPARYRYGMRALTRVLPATRAYRMNLFRMSSPA
ncbi:class I SAM-dependent methyltransferase [Micropruina sp.]|uniref:class I SAM-dependent methyltransferase n=1 Tax=Micropruina sp. TaxID=2737536 RepID=UPI0039E57C08